MDNHHMRTLVFLLFGVIMPEASTSLLTEYMPYPCKGGDTKFVDVSQEQSIQGSSKILKLDIYQPYANCSVVLKTWGVKQAITISVKSINLFNDDKILFNDGYTSTNVTGIIPKGRVLYTSIHPGANVNITFISGNHVGLYGFELVYTSFINGTKCDDLLLYQCRNGRCISLNVACDGFNHCGMALPEECGPDAGAIIGYSFGGVFFVLACVCIIVFLCRRRQKNHFVPSGTVLYPPPPGYVQPPSAINTAQYAPGNIQGPAPYQYPQGAPPYNAPDRGKGNPMYQ